MEKYYIYNIGSRIYVKQASAGPLNHVYAVAGDFVSDLSSCSHNNTVYYAYINSGDTLVIKNLLSSSVLYEFKNTGTARIRFPHISLDGKYIFLTYALYEPSENSYETKLYRLKEQPEEIPCKNKTAAFSGLHKMLSEKDAVINDIKLQYDELMDVAEKYRDEARKWYKKYTERL